MIRQSSWRVQNYEQYKPQKDHPCEQAFPDKRDYEIYSAELRDHAGIRSSFVYFSL